MVGWLAGWFWNSRPKRARNETCAQFLFPPSYASQGFAYAIIWCPPLHQQSTSVLNAAHVASLQRNVSFDPWSPVRETCLCAGHFCSHTRCQLVPCCKTRPYAEEFAPSFRKTCLIYLGYDFCCTCVKNRTGFPCIVLLASKILAGAGNVNCCEFSWKIQRLPASQWCFLWINCFKQRRTETSPPPVAPTMWASSRHVDTPAEALNPRGILLKHWKYMYFQKEIIKQKKRWTRM